MAKRAMWLVLSAAFALGLWLSWDGESEAQRCACAPSRCGASDRDARGCCPASACQGGGGGAGGGSKVRRPATRCSEGEHLSGGHCCRAGEEWVPGRTACVCLEPGGCTSAPAAGGPAPSGAEWVRIPGGTFWMGSPDGQGEDDEHPQHRVTLSAFSMHRTEVTVALYAVCVRLGRCSPPNTGDHCNWGVSGREQHPVNCVDWNQAVSFCSFVDGRLPTESEWEYAARGTDGRQYPWGDSSPDDARLRWSGGCGGGACIGSTSPVGGHPSGASPFGLEDMAGNVWEWTSDWYGPYRAGHVTDVRGPATGDLRVIRGGGWTLNQPAGVRAANRGWNGPAVRFDFLGFRCARGA